MPDKDDPARLLYPGFTDRIMVDTWRGKVRVRKWPAKRGRPKSANVRAQNDWFRDANRLASRAPGTQMSVAIAATKNSGLYPRDLLLRMMAGNLGTLRLADGRDLTKATKRIEPVSFQGVILNLLGHTVITANVSTALTWPLPIYDPLGFWSAGAPTLITIPPNISIVRFTGGLKFGNGLSARMRIWFQPAAGTGPRASSGLLTNVGLTLDSGPVLVNEGDSLGLSVNVTRTLTPEDGDQSFFSCEILEAT